jgi:cyclase
MPAACARNLLLLAVGLVPAVLHAQATADSVKIRLRPLGGTVYIADAPDGSAGGNVVASIGPDGILLVDDMFAASVPALQRALQKVSSQPIRVVLNTHFHGDHIQGNTILGRTATVVAHENVKRRVSRGAAIAPYPMVTFADSLRLQFNGESIVMLHPSVAHTDGDAVIFFESTHVLHLGDMFFAGMFPAVYREGGGDIRQLIVALRAVLARFPADTKVVPGHGEVSTMEDLRAYVQMLETTVAAVERGLRKHLSAAELERDPAIVKYAALGDGGAQTLPQYVAMLVKLLQ